MKRFFKATYALSMMLIIGSSAGCTAFRNREAHTTTTHATKHGTKNPLAQVAAAEQFPNFLLLKLSRTSCCIALMQLAPDAPGAFGNFDWPFGEIYFLPAASPTRYWFWFIIATMVASRQMPTSSKKMLMRLQLFLRMVEVLQVKLLVLIR